MSRSWIRTILAALISVATASAQPALDHGASPQFDPAAFEASPPGDSPMVLAPQESPTGFQSDQPFAGPGYGPPADQPTGDVGVPSQGAPQYGGAPVNGEFDVVTAGPDQYTLRFPKQDQGFVYPPPDGRYFQPFDMPAHPSGASAAAHDGNCFGHNFVTGMDLREGNRTPLSQRTLRDPDAVTQFQQDAARAQNLQLNARAVPPAWTDRRTIVQDGIARRIATPENVRWNAYVQKLRQHPNQMGQMGFAFPGADEGTTNRHVDPTRGVPRQVELVNGQGQVVQRGTWQGLWHNQWFPLNVNTGASRPHDGYGIVRLNPPAPGKDSPGYMFTYNPRDRLQARAAQQFQGRRRRVPSSQVYPMPEFSADPNTRTHYQQAPVVPARDAYYPPRLPAVGRAGNRGGGGVSMRDVTD